MGIPYLRQILNKILVTHIKQCIPTLTHQINDEKHRTEKQR